MLVEHHEFAGHERVLYVSDRGASLRAIIAIHDRTLGPAVGGCRVFPYASEQDALSDVLRLSKGMTYKTALAGLPFGGGKSVIMADPSEKSAGLIAAFGKAVDELHGQYWTGEDVNFSADDVEILASHTPYVLGRTKGAANSGDPSPFTAGGVFAGIKGALRHVFGSDRLDGRVVAIQGVGSVGFNLARLIDRAGGHAIVCDVRSEVADLAASKLGATVVRPDEIYEQQCDVFAPCAMGGTISLDTIPRLRSKIVCGAANNQLSAPEAGRMLLDRKIAYAPDYVVNAGGILNAFGDFAGNYDVKEVWKRIEAIGDRVGDILAKSDSHLRPSHEIADEMAESILNSARQRELPSETI